MGAYREFWEYRFVDPAAIPPDAVVVRNPRTFAMVADYYTQLDHLAKLKGQAARIAWQAINDGSTFGDFQSRLAHAKKLVADHGPTTVRTKLVRMMAVKLWFPDAKVKEP